MISVCRSSVNLLVISVATSSSGKFRFLASLRSRANPFLLSCPLAFLARSWNFLLRTKNHTIKMPFLIPAPDFTPRQLHEQRITGTCEIQICRSVGPWSMGISHIEHSVSHER